MTDAIDLTATQRAVLELAAQHPDHRVDRFPDGVKGGARAKVLAALHARGLLKKHRANYRINERGLAAIGATSDEYQTPAPNNAERKVEQQTVRTDTKAAAVLELLQRPQGATLDELMSATGWQAHSVRGYISGQLRNKQKLPVESAKNDQGARCYRIVPNA